MTYDVVIPAEIDEKILDCAAFIAEDSITQALRWVTHVKNRIMSIGELPLAYPVSESESARLGFIVRKLSIGNYVVFYRVYEQERKILAVEFRHAARRRPGEAEDGD
jgi:plasmid stabilization system protein ParE